MSDDLSPIVPTSRKPTLGDRIRSIANNLRQEDDVQIKATSRILGAAAKLAENHDRLIDEVVEMVEEDLDQTTQVSQGKLYTVEQLQQQFENFNDAKAHFNLKARSWSALVDKLNTDQSPHTAGSNQATSHRSPARSQPKENQDFVSQRLERIEQDIRFIRGDIEQVLQLLDALLKKQ